MASEDVVLALLTRLEKRLDFATNFIIKVEIFQSIVIVLLLLWVVSLEARFEKKEAEARVSINQSITSESNQDKLNKNFVTSTKNNSTVDNKKHINGVDIEDAGNGNRVKE